MHTHVHVHMHMHMHMHMQVEPGSDLFTFLGGKAVVNRKRFLESLTRLRDARDGLAYVTVLYSIVSQALHRKSCCI